MSHTETGPTLAPPSAHPNILPDGATNVGEHATGSGPATPQSNGSFETNADAPPVSHAEVLAAAKEYAGLDPSATQDPFSTLESWPLRDLDLSQPASTLLRIGTQRAHANAEHSAGAVALTSGELELQEYVRWLAMLWRVYDAIEQALDAHATDPTLAPTYNPRLLARAPELAADINYLLTRLPDYATKLAAVPLRTVPDGPLPPFALPPFLEEVFTHPDPELAAYVGRLRQLSRNADLAPRLLAHAYVRYLGDLSGGQIISSRIKKAYGLSGQDGRRFYFFDVEGDGPEEESALARKKKLTEVKNWYRRGMDEGAGDDEAKKAALVREANLAFVLNTHLFTLIRPPTGERYYEKREREEERRAAIDQVRKPSWADRAFKVVYFFVMFAFGLFLAQVVGPWVWRFLEPYLEAYGELLGSKLG